jgi:hypothetical protein
MKNLLFLLSLFLILSCDKNDELPAKSQALNNPMQLYIINGDIEYYSEITDGSKPKKPIFIYDIPDKTEKTNNLTSKTSAQSVVFNFNGGIGGSTKSGCSITRYTQSGKTYETDAGVYGFNPYPLANGYLVRGYGKPNHNYYYGALILSASNKELKRKDTRGRTYNDNLSKVSSISIEYPFKANVTYQITLKTQFNDNRKRVDNVQSSGFPSLHAQLNDSGIISSDDKACQNDLFRLVTEHNYIKSYILENNIITGRDVVFKFSPTQAKNAITFTLHPARGERGFEEKIPTNNYTMVLRYVTIIEKPFDPSLNIELHPRRPYYRHR